MKDGLFIDWYCYATEENSIGRRASVVLVLLRANIFYGTRGRIPMRLKIVSVYRIMYAPAPETNARHLVKQLHNLTLPSMHSKQCLGSHHNRKIKRSSFKPLPKLPSSHH